MLRRTIRVRSAAVGGRRRARVRPPVPMSNAPRQSTGGRTRVLEGEWVGLPRNIALVHESQGGACRARGRGAWVCSSAWFGSRRNADTSDAATRRHGSPFDGICEREIPALAPGFQTRRGMAPRAGRGPRFLGFLGPDRWISTSPATDAREEDSLTQPGVSDGRLTRTRGTSVWLEFAHFTQAACSVVAGPSRGALAECRRLGPREVYFGASNAPDGLRAKVIAVNGTGQISYRMNAVWRVVWGDNQTRGTSSGGAAVATATPLASKRPRLSSVWLDLREIRCGRHVDGDTPMSEAEEYR